MSLYVLYVLQVLMASAVVLERDATLRPLSNPASPASPAVVTVSCIKLFRCNVE